MPIYLDLHNVPGTTAKDVAQVHNMDVLIEKEYDCHCLTYWIDELRGHAFCLIDAPSKESVVELHSNSHGLIPHIIIEVDTNLVQAFLGRITDPENAQLTETGLKIFDDSAYRIIMNVKIIDAILLEHTYGQLDAIDRMNWFHTVFRETVQKYNGREVSREGNELIASFLSAEKAVAAARTVKNQLSTAGELELRISIHAGEPVMQTDKLFGDTLQILNRMNFLNRNRMIHITTPVKELLNEDHFSAIFNDVFVHVPQDETFSSLLFDTLDKRYGEENFDVEEWGNVMAMSKSQFYRRTRALCGLSPNNLLKDYRLEKAKELMRRKDATISEITFYTGFTSPSYFTKCFKRRFAVLPLQYLKLAQR